MQLHGRQDFLDHPLRLGRILGELPGKPRQITAKTLLDQDFVEVECRSRSVANPIDPDPGLELELLLAKIGGEI